LKAKQTWQSVPSTAYQSMSYPGEVCTCGYQPTVTAELAAHRKLKGHSFPKVKVQCAKIKESYRHKYDHVAYSLPVVADRHEEGMEWL
jgi:hypothetical protein